MGHRTSALPVLSVECRELRSALAHEKGSGTIRQLQLFFGEFGRCMIGDGRRSISEVHRAIRADLPNTGGNPRLVAQGWLGRVGL
jgi:hypothetical protein